MHRGAIIFWCLIVATAGIRFLMDENFRPIGSFSCNIGENVKITGTVIDEPQEKETGLTYVVLSHKIYNQKRIVCGESVSVKVKSKLFPRLQYEDKVILEGNITEPMNFKSPNGKTFDYKNFLAKDEIFYEIKSASVLEVISSSSVSIKKILFSLKKRFVNSLERSLGEPHAALASGLVVGEKNSLGKDLLNDFRTVGLIHIIVLSGYNITIVADAIRKIFCRLPRVWGIVIGGVSIALFGILVGGGATVVRSCVMAGIALTADLFRRNYNVYTALLFAGLMMLIENPMILLHDPSFQLSFLATLGLILLSVPIEKKIIFITEKFGVRSIIASSLATQIFVSPYILYLMGQISIVGIFANIIILPFVPLTMLLVFLTGFVGMFIYPVSIVLGWGAHFLLSYELFIVQTFAEIPFASVSI